MLDSNLKWDGSKWVQLETAEKTKDSTHTYYEAKTDSFSSFAIVGLKGMAEATVTPTPVRPGMPATPAKTAAPHTPAPTEKVPGFGIVLAMVTISALYMLRKGKK
ncbi:MAG: PGF-pre-PGF domain-containing protein [Thermoplasmatales archaeon]|nr:PGF-pre-PGF domain-containing protein [Thermoplasmatales archaeon]